MADDASLPDDIDELMKAFGVDPSSAVPEPPASAEGAPAEPPAGQEGSSIGGGAAGAPQEGVERPSAPPPPSAQAPSLESFVSGGGGGGAASLDMLRDVKLKVRVEVGRTKMYVQDILRLASGSVVELERLTGDPLDVYVNDRLVARGEVLVINENFAIRITEVVHPGHEKKG